MNELEKIERELKIIGNGQFRSDLQRLVLRLTLEVQRINDTLDSKKNCSSLPPSPESLPYGNASKPPGYYF